MTTTTAAATAATAATAASLAALAGLTTAAAAGWDLAQERGDLAVAARDALADSEARDDAPATAALLAGAAVAARLAELGWTDDDAGAVALAVSAGVLAAVTE